MLILLAHVVRLQSKGNGRKMLQLWAVVSARANSGTAQNPASIVIKHHLPSPCIRSNEWRDWLSSNALLSVPWTLLNLPIVVSRWGPRVATIKGSFCEARKPTLLHEPLPMSYDEQRSKVDLLLPHS